MLDPAYRPVLADDHRFAEEQRRVHCEVNRVWPRRLGVTPAGMAQALSEHRPYRWRLARGRRDGLADVLSAIDARCPVAMLIGNAIPRHWVLIVGRSGDMLHCYEPSSGETRDVDLQSVRRARLRSLGFPRAFGFVVPKRR